MFENEEKRLKIDDLRTAQEGFNSSVHGEKIVVSIDRLTILADSARPTKNLSVFQR